jgi:flagellar motor switch protein FliN/FliY
MSIGPASVVPLDTMAGEPLVIRVNGAPIGRAEVVVAGEQYGLKVLDLDGLNLDAITP